MSAGNIKQVRHGRAAKLDFTEELKPKVKGVAPQSMAMRKRKLSNTGNSSTDWDVLRDVGTGGELTIDLNNSGSDKPYFDKLLDGYQSQYDNQMNTAQTTYEQMQAAADAAALKKKGYTNTRRMTMEKYIPETLRAMGLSNNGLASDALIGLDSNYTNYLLKALAEEETAKHQATQYLAGQKQSAENALSQGKLAVETAKNSTWEEIMKMASLGTADRGYLENLGNYYGYGNDKVSDMLGVHDSAAAKIEQEKSEAKAEADKKEKLSLWEIMAQMAQSGQYSNDILGQLGTFGNFTEEEMAPFYEMNSGAKTENEAVDSEKNKQEKITMWEQLASLADSGAYSRDFLTQYGELLGFTEEEMAGIYAIYDGNAEKDEQAQTEAEAAAEEELIGNLLLAADENGYSRETLEQIAKQRNMSEAGVSKLMELYDLTHADGIKQEEEIVKEAEQAVTDERVLSGKEYIQYNNAEYKIKEKLDEDAKEITRNNDFKEKLKNLGFTNPYDSKIPNGTTLEIKCAIDGSNDFNLWRDVIGPMTFGPLAVPTWFNTRTRYVTYYNGEWYLSDKIE